MKYYPWIDDDEDDSLAWIMDRPRFTMDEPRWFEVFEGMSVRAWFKDGEVLQLSPDFGTRIADHVPNTSGLLVVSERLRGVLEASSGAAIEFLPVTLRDRNGRDVKKPYFIANILETRDCVDEERSEFRRSSIRKDQVSRFFRLALDERRIGRDDRIFRLKVKNDLVIVREDLGQAILDAGCGGMIFQELEDYGLEFRPL